MSEEPAAPASVKTIIEACDYLKSQGWKCSKSKFHDDMKASPRRVRKNDQGRFTREALDRYAQKYLDRIDGTSARDAEDEHLALRRAKAETREAEARADERELKVAQIEGRLVPADQHERDLAARALQLRSDFETFAYEIPLRIVERYALSAEAIGELREILVGAGQEWFRRYTDRREYVAHLPEPDEDPEMTSDA